MKLDYDTTTGTIIITLAGDLDITEKRTILDQVAAVLPLIGVDAIALEMSEVTHLDTAAMKAMVAAERICLSQGKRLLVRHPSRSVERALRATSTAHRFGLGGDRQPRATGLRDDVAAAGPVPWCSQEDGHTSCPSAGNGAAGGSGG